MEETGGVPLALRRIALTKSMLIPAETLPFSNIDKPMSSD